jgi:hypothetical protein
MLVLRKLVSKKVFLQGLCLLSLCSFGGSKSQDIDFEVIKLSPQQITDLVERHNFYRSQVKTAPLKWSQDLANYAKKWAVERGKSGCNIKHRPRKGEFAQLYGENLYWSSGLGNVRDAVESWASEKADYDGGYFVEKNFEAGHYTQIIWAKTTEVGCAVVRCASGTLVICNYNPAGNVVGYHPIRK